MMDVRSWAVALAAVLWLGAGQGTAHAAGSRAEVRKSVEASMLLQGTIDIDREGKVVDYDLKQAQALPDAMRAILDRRVRSWRFEPVLVEGKPVNARSPMRVRLVTQRAGENFLLRIGGASFTTEESLSDGKLIPPTYPDFAVRAGVGGTVYLLLRVGREGKVVDAIAEQVNLSAVGTEPEMKRFRHELSRSAISATRRWRFKFPASGEDADEPFMSVRVPVDYVYPGQKQEKPGEWHAYVPGPRERAPWLSPEPDDVSADAIAAWGIYPVGKGPRLLTPLEES